MMQWQNKSVDYLFWVVVATLAAVFLAFFALTTGLLMATGGGGRMIGGAMCELWVLILLMFWAVKHVRPTGKEAVWPVLKPVM